MHHLPYPPSLSSSTLSTLSPYPPYLFSSSLSTLSPYPPSLSSSSIYTLSPYPPYLFSSSLSTLSPYPPPPLHPSPYYCNPLSPIPFLTLCIVSSTTTVSSYQINAAAEVIYEAVDPNANIIFGALVDESMNGEIAITVIATGFPVMSTADALSGNRHTRESCHDKSYNSSMFRNVSDFSPSRMSFYDQYMSAFSLVQLLL